MATAVGFLVLLSSPVPMVRGFGALLVLGIGLALACALCAGFAALTRFGRGRAGPAPRAGRGCRRVADAAWRALGVALAARAGCWRSASCSRWPGWPSTPRARWCPTCASWCPSDLPALEDVNVLQEETGVAGEIDVTVRADDITDPEVVAWMTRFQRDVLRAHGYRPGKRLGQEHNPPELCPALSLPDLFATAGGGGAGARRLLESVPPSSRRAW